MSSRIGKPVGILGGMFDPIHYGHLRPALEILQSLALDHVRFVPCADPPHRPAPATPAALRAALVAAAIADQPGFMLDERELQRPGPSYTVDTLDELRREFPATPLCLLLGMDAFLGLPRWHRWQQLLELAHVVVMHRPGSAVPADGELATLLAARRVSEAARLAELPAGNIYLQAVTQLEISSTAVRAACAAGHSPRYLLPDAAWQLIQQHDLYGAQHVEV